MDMYTVKKKILEEIANADSSLSPYTSHVYGNWRISVWQKQSFPIVTVRMETELVPMWSRITPTVEFGECWLYKFSLYIFSSSMANSRILSDKIIDYFAQNNKFPTEKIIDIINFTSTESILQTGPRKQWRTIVTFVVMTEEALT